MSDDDLVKGFEQTSTGVLGDALLRLGLYRHVEGVHPVGGDCHVVGRAFTVLYRSQSLVDPGTVGDYIDEVQPGQVVVLDNRGRTDCTVWGDILTLVASKRNVAGTVIDGACRDTERAVETGYPLFAKQRTMRTGKGRVEVAAVNQPVSLGAAHVSPGDLIVGDRDGVCVVPWTRAAEVLETSQAIQSAEQSIESRVHGGSSLRQARHDLGYFSLQEPPSAQALPDDGS